MKINEELVDKLAHLARLEFNDSQKVKIEEDLNRILSFMDSLNEVDTSNVEPLIYLTEEKNVFRADVIKQDITHKDGLKNAPKSDSDYFRVPKVIEQK